MENIIEVLTTGHLLLKKVGETFWSNKIESVLKLSLGNDTNVDYEELLSWFGGMGSFNDLIISKYNGHILESNNEDSLNDDLEIIKTKLFTIASARSGDFVPRNPP